MPSFEEEDGRVAAQRAVRHVRQMLTQPSRDFPSDPLKIGAWRHLQRRPLDDSDQEDDDDEEHDEYAGGESVPQQRKMGRAPPSVSFSEPVETPPPESRRELKTPSPSVRRSHNRLETRLAELQRDVANLSMRLRTSSHKSASFQDEEEEDDVPGARRKGAVSRPARREVSDANGEASHHHAVNHRSGTVGKSPARTILKKPAHVGEEEPTRRSASRSRPRAGDKENDADNGGPYRGVVSRHTLRPVENGHEQDDRPLRVRVGNGQPEPPPKSAKEMLRVVRELRVVAVERDQLRYELDQTKRTLAALERKAHDAAKWKGAYDKMKAHCDSLQESLELSEKIRVRQKRLLQQLQQTVKQDEAAKARSRLHAPHRGDVFDSVLHNTSTTTVTAQQPARRATPRRVETVNQAPARPVPSRQAPAAVNTSTRSYSRSDFDSLLQVPIPERSIAGSTMYRRTTQPKKEPVPSRSTMVSRTARPSQVPPPVPSASRVGRPTYTTARSNRFLEPTQSSLCHIAKRRPEATRPPFVV